MKLKKSGFYEISRKWDPGSSNLTANSVTRQGVKTTFTLGYNNHVGKEEETNTPLCSLKRGLVIFVAAALLSGAAVGIYFLVSNERDSQGSTNLTSDRPTTVKPTSSGSTISDMLTTTTGPPDSTTVDSTALPIQGAWSSWGSWSTCTLSCGTGFHTRYRTCIKSSKNATNCLGDYVQHEACTDAVCPVYGKWDTWSTWGSCDVTCGGGARTRTRTCNKSSATDINCTGSDKQSQTCSEWNCPDCSKICAVGTLNVECDACICESNTVTGRVTNDEGTPLVGVTIARTETPLNVLTSTNASGYFKLDATCETTSLLFSKTAYQDATAMFSNVSLEIKMILIEYPRFIQEPVTKYRLTNETVIMCCDAVGNPRITYIEWFKNGNPLHSDLYPNEKQLKLINVSQEDSGEYRCRANSPARSTMSEPATLTVKDSPSGFCSTSYTQKKRSLPDDCVQAATGLAEYEVGDCDNRGCRENATEEDQCEDQSSSCCGVSDFGIDTVQCNGYSLKVIVVKGCTCKACPSATVSVIVEAKGDEDGEPLYYGEVYVNGQYKGRTNRFGYFSFEAPSTLAKVTLTLIDAIQNKFVETTKVVSIAEINDDSIYVLIRMLKAVDPVDIDPSVENNLSTDLYNASNNVHLTLPASSFYHTDGTKYNGKVEASFTFLDPSNTSVLSVVPGVFQTVNVEGEDEQLQSLGVFSLAFKDKSGNSLYLSENIDVYLPIEMVNTSSIDSEMTLWVLSRTSGKWEAVTVDPDVKKRKRRQAGDFWVGAFTPMGTIWANIDEIPDVEACYFKITVFETYNLLVKTNSVFFEVALLYQTSQGYIPYSAKVSDLQDCIIFNCRQPATGLIEVSYWNSSNRKVNLLPVDPNVHNVPKTLANRYAALNYGITNNGRVVQINPSISNDGPFFSSHNNCKLDKSLAFLFYLPSASTDVYTYKHKFTPSDIGDDGITFDVKFSSDMAWYQDRSSKGTASYRSCFIKIKVTGLNNLNGETLTVRITNAGGTIVNVLDEIYGIREYKIDTSFTDATETICVEYKCSGAIGVLYRQSTDIDNTKVNVIPIPPVDNTCVVSFVSSSLGSKLNNTHTIGTETYTFSAPEQTQVEDGLFEKEGDDINSIREESEKRCLSGETDVLDKINPNLNVALVLNCN